MMEKKEGIAVYIYRMQDKRDDKSQSPLFLSRAAARYAFGAVSYTHLDVYKRQVRIMCSSGIRRATPHIL